MKTIAKNYNLYDYLPKQPIILINFFKKNSDPFASKLHCFEDC